MKSPSIHERGTPRHPMVDPPFIPRDADIIAAGFVSAVLILLLGLVLTVPFAGAQTVPFDGRIDSYTDGINGSYNLEFGDFGSYHGGYYAAVEWTPTSTGIFCGFETIFESANSPIDVSVSGSGIQTVSWTSVDVSPISGSGETKGFYLWPEECFTFTSGTKYRFDFSTTGGVTDATMIWGASATPTNYVLWQYNDGLGWSVKNGHPEFTIIGTSDASSTEWYQQNVEPDLPSDISVTDWWGGWKDLGTELFTVKAPFGYVSSVMSIWDNLGTGTTSDFVLDINGAAVKLMDATTTKDAIGADNWTLIRGFIEALLWFGFMMYLVTRINQIQV